MRLPTITPKEFVDKWSKIKLKERSASQSHFNDICALVGHKTPTEADPEGTSFTFETYTAKTEGDKGFIDAWYKGHFAWEYKGIHANLDKAYNQLLLYRESCGNPPLLITSDMQRIIIHTNFTNTAKEIHEIDFDKILNSDGLDLLKRCFYDPLSFEPSKTQEQVTEATADTFVSVAEAIQKWELVEHHTPNPERIAHFIVRLLFSLFAEDIGLLPESVFTKLVSHDTDIAQFTNSLRSLFTAMRNGGLFGFYQIPHFNGGLFDDDFVPELPGDITKTLYNACIQDWSGIEPSIFGTLFERIIDESKRAQLGLHYTSQADIMLIVEPVLMQPLRAKWHSTKQQANILIEKKQFEAAHTLLAQFADYIANIRVLDPACGSGNFLYIALKQLLDLQKQVIIFNGCNKLPKIPLTVSPKQLYGIELNLYAHELAQVTVWIGYIQWRFENGFREIDEPILRSLKNIVHKDAILTHNKNGNPSEFDWPEVDVIIGNPPFLGGGRRMREELDDEYVEQLMELYRDRVPGGADLVCYWFEKARAMLEMNKAKRVGLLATQSIRGGTNRKVLERIKQTGDIFMAWSDREWIQEGVMVHISMIGFDRGYEKYKTLDGMVVQKINSDLTSKIDLTLAKSLVENANICFRGVTKTGDFELTQKQAREMLASQNSNNCPNSDVIKPSINASDITLHLRHMWLIDFDGLSLEEAKCYEKPFQYVVEHVKPFRDISRQQILRDNWWLFERSRPAMRKAIAPLGRFIVTPLTSKHKLYVWAKYPTLPDQANYIFAREDDYFFGVLHSYIHELWVRRKGTQLREAESGKRYSPSETFETFPFPWIPSKEPSENENHYIYAIAELGRKLENFRQEWLFPCEEDTSSGEKQVKQRTLTNLYNSLDYYREVIKGKQRNPEQWKKDVKGIITINEIEELDHIHFEINNAVLDAYGWQHNLSDEEILERLLSLNLKRSEINK